MYVFVSVCACACVLAYRGVPLAFGPGQPVTAQPAKHPMSDVAHVEFSLQRKVKQSHMHATALHMTRTDGGGMVD